MMVVPRREVICLDSQIEKINRRRRTCNLVVGRSQTASQEGFASPPPPRPSPQLPTLPALVVPR